MRPEKVDWPAGNVAESEEGDGIGATAGEGRDGVQLGGSDTGKKRAGFKRSRETVTCLFFFKIIKVFGVFFITGNGPSYGGTRGGLTASTRRRTWEAASRAGSTRERGTPWWSTGIGRAAFMMDWRLWAKEDAKGTGWEQPSMSPGSLRGPPYRRSAGAQPESSRTEVRSPKRTKGRWSSQHSVPEPAA